MRGRTGRLGAFVWLAACVPAFASQEAHAAGALDDAAEAAARILGPVPGRSVVVAAHLASDQKAPQGEALAVRIAALVASRIGGGARAHAATADLAVARAVADRASALVYVESAIAGGDLRVTVFVYPPMGNAWDRIRNPLPAPTKHAFAAAKIDAEVRAFLAPLLLEQAQVHRAHHDEGAAIAAACGDVDGDGGNELVIVSRARIALGRVRGSRFVADRTAAWADLAAEAPIPMREPLASAIVALGAVNVGSTDRGGLSLTADLAASTASLSGLPSWGGHGLVCLRAEPSAGAFDGAPIDCTLSRDPKPVMAVPAPRFDAFAAASVTSNDGHVVEVVAVREPNGSLRLKIGDTSSMAEGVFGAQLAVGDLDEDGVPDIATSVDGTEDAINVVDTDPTTGQLRLRLHIATPEPVRALTFCPPEVDGAPALVGIVGGDVWIIRPSTSP